MNSTINIIYRIAELKSELAYLENNLTNKLVSDNNECRMENLRGIAIPICGHDILTEFMIRDLDAKSNNGIYFFGGLFAPKDQSNFHWYVSTIRLNSLETFNKYLDAGKPTMVSYLGKAFSAEIVQILKACLTSPKTKSELKFSKSRNLETDLNWMKTNRLITIKDKLISLTNNGIQLYALGTHLTLNHLIKPEPDLLNTILDALTKIIGPPPSFTEAIDQLLNKTKSFDDLMKVVTLSEEYKKLIDKGITNKDIVAVLKIYYLGPI